ncbi:2'-5' RNA ligase [Streptomyces achromogenes]|uniref:2'-5' RNA ligase n=1 Tax=Streptomyces achromogenes TaxID=67255 RepID=A0ABU0QCW4_STRAH|nr:2'-5' RNA ligase family protein [Streptomyces achromogenes]MDQ0688482.1 2'-5' RNA ligase [Streptomyces achromogenes]MDQ0835674.1 2'-5' RNA ligase [Streptomyces achromogenes]
MAGDDSSGFQAGQSGLIVRVPEAEPVVRAWRERLDPSARAGVPAHVTVLFPFLDESSVDDGVCAAVAEVIGRHRPFEVRFERCGRFPGSLYLVPEPGIPFVRLTEAIADRWPQHPPFGGRFDEVVPHLTIAQGQDDAVLEEVEAGLRDRLPVTGRVSSVDLMVHDGTGWRHRASFALR